MNRASLASHFAALGDEKRLEVIEHLWLGDLTTGVLASRVDIPVNLLAHHLDVLERAGFVRRRRSDGDGRKRYVSLVEAHVPDELAPPPRRRQRVLFTCSRNSARSQLAASMFKRRTGRLAESAGVRPADVIDPRAVEVAATLGLRIEGAPRGYQDVVAIPDLIVSVCDMAGEGAPPFGGVDTLHWSVADPVSDGRMGAFERAAAEVDARVVRLAAVIG